MPLLEGAASQNPSTSHIIGSAHFPVHHQGACAFLAMGSIEVLERHFRRRLPVVRLQSTPCHADEGSAIARRNLVSRVRGHGLRVA